MTKTVQVVLGTFIGWLFRLNPEEENQQEFMITSVEDAGEFLGRHQGDAVELFSRFQRPDGTIELDGGFNPAYVVGSPAYVFLCDGCKKPCWSHGTPDPSLVGATCADCSDQDRNYADFNNYDADGMSDREY